MTELNSATYFSTNSSLRFDLYCIMNLGCSSAVIFSKKRYLLFRSLRKPPVKLFNYVEYFRVCLERIHNRYSRGKFPGEVNALIK